MTFIAYFYGMTCNFCRFQNTISNIRVIEISGTSCKKSCSRWAKFEYNWSGIHIQSYRTSPVPIFFLWASPIFSLAPPSTQAKYLFDIRFTSFLTLTAYSASYMNYTIRLKEAQYLLPLVLLPKNPECKFKQKVEK